MSKRSQEKRITTANRALKFLREQAGLSFRQASRDSRVSVALINHLENGRMEIGQRHLEKLLPAYKVTMATFHMFANGSVELPQDLKAECAEIVQSMSLEQLRTAFPILKSLSNHR